MSQVKGHNRLHISGCRFPTKLPVEWSTNCAEQHKVSVFLKSKVSIDQASMVKACIGDRSKAFLRPEVGPCTVWSARVQNSRPTAGYGYTAWTEHMARPKRNATVRVSDWIRSVNDPAGNPVSCSGFCTYHKPTCEKMKIEIPMKFHPEFSRFGSDVHVSLTNTLYLRNSGIADVR